MIALYSWDLNEHSLGSTESQLAPSAQRAFFNSQTDLGRDKLVPPAQLRNLACQSGESGSP